ncbi:heavy-metal-associated domain-containing protein [Streptomyces sp. URMC 123]|uniref:heavy-metal-associated domain-containing protein n=1 Tax=Streptomyces sp. URMC 123 TaxID=3423403 RepID=UPI003F1E2C91
MTAETPTGCCSSDSSCGDATGAGAVSATYRVSGMSCGHCEKAISAELSDVPGVASVTAVSATGLVTVTSDAPLDEETVRAAIDEAGYELVGRA